MTYKTNDLEQMEQQRQENAAIKNAVDKILAQAVEPGMSDYETAKALHDYLVLNCAYEPPADPVNEPTYIVKIPPEIDFGEIVLDEGPRTCSFTISAQDVSRLGSM